MLVIKSSRAVSSATLWTTLEFGLGRLLNLLFVAGLARLLSSEDNGPISQIQQIVPSLSFGLIAVSGAHLAMALSGVGSQILLFLLGVGASAGIFTLNLGSSWLFGHDLTALYGRSPAMGEGAKFEGY
jgi:hypothetical protein